MVSSAIYLRQGGYVLLSFLRASVCLSVCPSVCLLAPSINTTDLHGNFTIDVYMDMEELIKFWKLWASGYESRIF